MLSLAAGLMMAAPSLWAQLGNPPANNQGNQPNGQAQAQQGQVAPQQKPAPIVPANPVARNAQEVQQSKKDIKKVQKSEVKTLADIQKSEDHDINAIRNDSTLRMSARNHAIVQVRKKYDAMRRDLRLATHKTDKLETLNKGNAKAKELKAENKSSAPIGQ